MISDITVQWPQTIEFGVGKINTLKKHLQDHKRVFFLIDLPIRKYIDSVISELSRSNIEVLVSTDVVPEPPFEALDKLLLPVREFNPDVVVGIGGGSAMDLAKLVAILYSGEQKAEEVLGIDNVQNRKVKLITASTTSGTGSEVTPIAILTDLQAKLKKGVVSKYLIPDIAIVDPELTISLPASVTAATGMDAMTHCIEAYTNKYAHPIIDNIAIEGIRLIALGIEDAVKNGNNLQARTQMALGSLYGGMCLGPVNTAAVHALAYPLGGEYKVPHGVANSVLLPFVMNFNMPSSVEKYAKIAVKLGISAKQSAEQLARQAVLKIREISNNCNIPPSIQELGIPESAISSMANSAMQVVRLLGNNPREVSLEDAEAIYRNAYNGVLD